MTRKPATPARQARKSGTARSARASQAAATVTSGDDAVPPRDEAAVSVPVALHGQPQASRGPQARHAASAPPEEARAQPSGRQRPGQRTIAARPRGAAGPRETAARPVVRRPKVVLIGHSHLGCVDRAYQLLESEQQAPFDCKILQLLRPEIPYMVIENNKVIYNRVLDPEVEACLDQEKPDLVVLMMEGQQAASQGFIYPTHPYDFSVPGQPFVRAMKGDYAPYDMVLTVASMRYLHIEDFLIRIRSFIKCPVVALGPPPISQDDAMLIKTLQRIENVRKSIEKHGLPPAAWRWKTWRLHVTAIGEMFARQAIPFYEPPSVAFDTSQFIDPRFVSDAAHGNLAYGQLMIRQIMEIFTAQQGG